VLGEAGERRLALIQAGSDRSAEAVDRVIAAPQDAIVCGSAVVVKSYSDR
jgi:hypothetical protein